MYFLFFLDEDDFLLQGFFGIHFWKENFSTVQKNLIFVNQIIVRVDEQVICIDGL